MFKPKFNDYSQGFNTDFNSYQALKGEDGFSPIVDVQPIDNGYSISITDVNETHFFEIKNGEQGPQGEKAPQSDWRQEDVTKPDYIKNKPTIEEIASEVVDVLFVNEFYIEDLAFTLNDDKASYTCIGFEKGINTSNITEITIPETANGLPVTTIGDDAFANNHNLTKVHIPDTVLYIGRAAFYNCTALTDIYMSKNIQRIEEQAFGECDAIQNFYIKSVEGWCSVELGDAFSSPLYHASGDLYLIGCDGNSTKLERLIVPNSITKINQYTFQGSLTIKELVIPESVEIIGNSAFSWNSNLVTIYLPVSLKTIEESAFASCTKLDDVELGVGKVYYAAGYNEWREMTIANHNSHMFFATRVYNTSYVEPSIPTKVSELENDAEYITEKDIPEFPTVPTKVSAFENDANYAKKEEIPCMPTEGLVYEFDSETQTYGCLGFSSRSKYYNKVIVASEINGYPVTRLTYHSDFGQFDTASEVVLPKSLLEIDSDMFGFNSYTKIINIPESVTFIDTHAFIDCFNLDIYCEAKQKPDGWHKDWNVGMNPSPLGRDTRVFWNQKPATQDYVDAAIPTKVSELENDANYAKKEEIPCIPTQGLAYRERQNANGTTSYSFIGFERGVDPNSFTKLVIAGEVNGYPVTNIEYYFADCKNLTEIVLPDSITSLGDHIIEDCFKLTSLILPKNLKYISSSAIRNCPLLKSIYIPESVTHISPDGVIPMSGGVIYCEAKEKPDGWHEYWGGGIVYWNQKPATQAYVDEAIRTTDLGDYITETKLADKNFASKDYVDAENEIILAVAEGKNRSFICDTVEDMVEKFGATATDTNSYTFTLPETFTDSIKTGDVILIKDINVPDYWLEVNEDGKTGSLHILETTKVDLSEYETLEHASATYATKESIPTHLSQLNNDTRYITQEAIPTKVSEFENDENFVPKTYVDEAISGISIPDVSGFITEIPDEYVTETELNDKGYLTEHQSLDDYATKEFVSKEIAEAQLAGKDIDLSVYYTKSEVDALIPDTSEFITDIPDEYITETELDERNYATKSELPTKLSELENDTEYATVSEIPTKISKLENDADYITDSEVSKTYVSNIDLNSREYATKSEIPTVPTKVTDLTNDADFVSQEYVDAQNANTLAVAEGKNKSFVCDDIADMLQIFGATAAENNSYSFTLPEEFPESIKTGDVILIKQIDVPDYWIATDDGVKGTLYILETTKVDLTKYETISHASSTYATKTEVNQKSDATNILNGTLTDGTVAKNALRTATGKALHENATVFGYNNISPNDSVLMSGNYCLDAPVDTWDGNKIFFSVGNGYWHDVDGKSELLRRNAFEVRKCGDALVQRDFYVSGKLEMGNTLKIGNTTINETQLQALLNLIK